MKSYSKLLPPLCYAIMDTLAHGQVCSVFAIVVEHCCPTGLFPPEYIILINYTGSPLNLNDLQKERTKSWSCDFLCGPRFL